jgi:hypothetical protein
MYKKWTLKRPFFIQLKLAIDFSRTYFKIIIYYYQFINLGSFQTTRYGGKFMARRRGEKQKLFIALVKDRHGNYFAFKPLAHYGGIRKAQACLRALCHPDYTVEFVRPRNMRWPPSHLKKQSEILNNCIVCGNFAVLQK